MRFRATAVPLVCLSLIAYFAYHLFVGERGLEARAKLEMRISTLGGELKGLKAVRAKLDRDVSLLRAEHLDPDMLDERARAILNFAHPDDIILVEPKQDPSGLR